MRTALLLATLFATLLVSAPGFAADAHVHGEARLAVAIDDGTLSLILESPTDSLVGFEHAPRTARERAAVTKMKQTLERPAEVFRPTQTADCKPVRVKLESALLESKHTHHDGHANLNGEFVFACAAPQHLRDLDVRLFKHFPDLKKLKVEVAAPRGQKAVQLTKRQHKVSWYMSEPVVRFSDLRFDWGDVPCLDIAAFELAAGEAVFLYGATGSGKTTLLNLLAGVLLPRAGELRILGESLPTLSGKLDTWSDDDDRGRFVFIVRDLEPVFVEQLLTDFSGAANTRAGGERLAALLDNPPDDTAAARVRQ